MTKFLPIGILLWSGLFSEVGPLEKIFVAYSLSQDSRQLVTQILKEWNVPYGPNLSLYEALVKDYHCQRCNQMADSTAYLASLGKNRKEIFDALFESVEKNTAPFDFAESFRSYEITVGNSPALGNPKAKTKIVVFLDFLCGHCKSVRDELKQEAGANPTGTFVVFKHLSSPGSGMSLFFVRLAMAAKLQDKYDLVSDFIYDIAPSMTRSFDEARIYEGLSKLKVDVSKIKKDMNAEAVARDMKADADLSSKLKVSGAPMIFLNGKPYRGSLEILFKQGQISERVVNGK